MEFVNEIAKSLGIPAPFVWIAAGAFLFLILRRAFDRSSERALADAAGALQRAEGRSSFQTSLEVNKQHSFHFQIDGKAVDLSDSQAGEFFKYLKAGDKMSAIKLLRSAGEIGLADAKNIAEAMEKSLEHIPDLRAAE